MVSIISAEGDGPHRSLDTVGVQLDPPIGKKALQPIPVVQRVADRLGGRPARRQFPQLLFEPGAQFQDQWAALGLTRGKTVRLALAANACLDLIERAYALERLGRDRCRLGLGQIIKAATHMAPAERQRHAWLIGLGPNELLVGVIPVALQDAAITAKQGLGMMMTAAGRVVVDHGGRLAAAPRPVITRDGPEIALLGAAAAWIEHRHDGLVGEQPRRTQHDLPQPGDHRGKLGRRIAHPERQGRAIEHHAPRLRRGKLCRAMICAWRYSGR